MGPTNWTMGSKGRGVCKKRHTTVRWPFLFRSQVGLASGFKVRTEKQASKNNLLDAATFMGRIVFAERKREKR